MTHIKVLVKVLAMLVYRSHTTTQGRSIRDKKGWRPKNSRPHKISNALKAYAMFVSSANKGATRDFGLK